MTVVSTKEFSSNQDKYFEMALHERVFIERGNNMFHLVCNPVVDDGNDEDNTRLLALAKSRRSNRNREFTSIDEFINFLEK